MKALNNLAAHYNLVKKNLLDGRVIPFLGAGASLCGRNPAKAPWILGESLPIGSELAEYLAKECKCSAGFNNKDLLRVAQYYTIAGGGESDLYRDLHKVFSIADTHPKCAEEVVSEDLQKKSSEGNNTHRDLHCFFARLPSILRSEPYKKAYENWKAPLVIATTNYDTLLEEAFKDANEPYELVYYEAKRADSDCFGKFRHKSWGSAARRPIENPNAYTGLYDAGRTVILKLHGSVDKDEQTFSSYVITENDYIDYLAHDNIFNQLPVPIPDMLVHSHLLFLGYSLVDWNMRVILRRIKRQQQLKSVHWAINIRGDGFEKEFWDREDVKFYKVDILEYIRGLEKCLVPNGDEGGGG